MNGEALHEFVLCSSHERLCSDDVPLLIDVRSNFSLSLAEVRRSVKPSLSHPPLPVRVGVFCSNGPYYGVAVLKLLALGASAVLVNVRDRTPEVVRQLDVCGVSTCLVDDGDASAKALFPARICCVGIAAFCLGRSLLPPGGEVARECVIVFSSGTTGLPKGVRLSHANLVATLRMRFRHRQPLECVLSVMPMHHAYGLILVLASLVGGSRLVMLTPPFSIDDVVAAVVAHGVGEAPLVTPLIRDLVARGDLHAPLRQPGSLRRVHNGGTTLDEATVRALVAALPGLEFSQGYGLSETAGGFVYTDLRRPPKLDSIGHAYDGVECRVAPDGELLVRGPVVFSGYVGGEADGVDAEGFLHTGDVVRRDEEGYWYILGRKKEVFKVNGEQVSPTELEGHVLQASGGEVLDVAVVGVAHARKGHVPVAHVLMRPGSALSAEQLRQRTNERVAPFKRLDAVVVRAEPIPKTATGKIQRSRL